MSYLLLTCIIFALAIGINSASVFLQKRYRYYDRFKHGWFRHSLVITPVWSVFVYLAITLNSHYTIHFSSIPAIGYALIGMGVILFVLAIREIGAQALTNGNFFNQGKVSHSNVFKYLKNPIYDSYFLLFLGVALALGNGAYFILAIESFIGLNIIESHFESIKSNPVQRKTIPALLILTVLVSVTLLSSDVSRVADWSQSLRVSLAATGLWAPVLYSAAYTIVGLSGFSVTVLSLIALGLFPPATAFLVIFISATLSASLAFAITRKSSFTIKFGEHSLPLRYLHGTAYRLSQKIEQQTTTHGFRLMLLLRLSRLPYIALSYAAGTVRSITMRSFIAATAITNAASAIVYVLLGAAIAAYLGAALLAGVLIILILVVYKERRHSAPLH